MHVALRSHSSTGPSFTIDPSPALGRRATPSAAEGRKQAEGPAAHKASPAVSMTAAAAAAAAAAATPSAGKRGPSTPISIGGSSDSDGGGGGEEEEEKGSRGSQRRRSDLPPAFVFELSSSDEESDDANIFLHVEHAQQQHKIKQPTNVHASGVIEIIDSAGV